MSQLDLSDFFTTKLQASDFSARLAAINEQIFNAGFKLEDSLTEQFGIEKKDKFLSLIRDQQISIDSTKSLKEFFEAIQKEVSQIPTLSMTVAFEPKKQTMKILSDWFLLNLKKQVVFDIKVDQKIIGGAIISFNGKYLDYSIRPKLEEVSKEVLLS